MPRSTRAPRPRATWLWILTLLLLTVGGGCGRNADSGRQAPPTGRPDDTVVIGQVADLGSVNELTSYTTAINTDLLNRMFLQLLEESPDFTDQPPTFGPRLAKSWEWSDDRLAITFHLRDDVVWSDGVPVTAEDVRWTWKAQTHPDVAWEAAYFKRSIRDVEVIDEHTVRYHFTQVDPAQLLHANEGVILPKHVWGRLPFSEWRQAGRWFRDHLVTNGPFLLDSWRPGEELVLVKNPTYYEPGLPRVDRVVVRIVPDQATLMARLLAGDVDFVTGLSPEDAARVRASKHLQLNDYWNVSYIFVAWNNRNPLFAEPRVRRALTLAMDRQTMVEALWGNYAKVGTSPIVSTVWAHNDALEPWPFDPGQARTLLAETGWRDRDGDGLLDRGGEPFRFELLVHSGNRQRQDAAIMMQQQLGALGIDVELRTMDFSTFVSYVTEGNYDACVAGFTMGTDLDLRYLLHSDQIDAGLNYAHYSNPEVDRLIEQANRQPTAVEMKPYLDRIQAIVHEEQPLTFLWESKRLNAINRRIQGAEPNLLSPLYNLREWWIEPMPQQP